jgi:hypothetical protein
MKNPLSVIYLSTTSIEVCRPSTVCIASGKFPEKGREKET